MKERLESAAKQTDMVEMPFLLHRPDVPDHPTKSSQLSLSSVFCPPCFCCSNLREAKTVRKAPAPQSDFAVAFVDVADLSGEERFKADPKNRASSFLHSAKSIR